MLTLFRYNAGKYAYDTASGAVLPLTSLEYRILELLSPPLSPALPVSLRYELAKFDSDTVGDTYRALYEKYRNGMIFAPESGVLAPPLTGDKELSLAAARAAAEALPDPVELGDRCPEEIRNIFKETGKCLAEKEGN